MTAGLLWWESKSCPANPASFISLLVSTRWQLEGGGPHLSTLIPAILINVAVCCRSSYIIMAESSSLSRCNYHLFEHVCRAVRYEQFCIHTNWPRR